MTRTTRIWALGALALGLLVGAACTPDETGYGDPNEGDLATGEDPSLDESGLDADDGAGVRGSEVYYAPSDVLGALAIDVTVIAPTGTFATDALSVGVAGGEAADPLVVLDGGFVGTIVGAAGAVVEIKDGATLLASVTLEEGEGMAAPGGAEDSDVLDLGASFSSPSAGEIPVGDGTFSLSAPYLAYNLDGGASVLVEAGDVGATLAADSGDTVCLAATQAGAAALGVPSCAAVP